jgi:DNA-binding MarR family transcriptional regulator
MSAELQSALMDLALWLYHGFFLPGDQLPSLSPGSVQSGLVSAVVWLGAIILIVMICRFIRDVDRALTAFVLRLYDELRSTVRMVARRLGIAFRSFALERQARLTRTEVAELPALTELQLDVLRSHVGLSAGHLLTPSEVASALDMRVSDVERVLGALKKLSLVERSFGAGDGEDGYRLTRPGKVLLAAYCRTQPLSETPVPQRSVRPNRIEPRLGSLG